jgi:DTW domain-containing protein YfiP
MHPESLTVAVGKRFGFSKKKSIFQLLESSGMREKGSNLWLVYPGPDAMPLEKALEQRRQTEQTNEGETLGVTLIFLDATWKYAREMDRANQQNNQYPDHMLRVQLSPTDLESFSPGRFDIRTPLSEYHLCTAEALSRVVAKVEGRPEIHEALMRPLDLMVTQWRSFIHAKKAQQEDDG